MLLEEKIALITGAARGNGAAIAKGLADQGAIVVLIDLDKSGIESIAKQINDDLEREVAYVYELDVSCAEKCQETIASIESNIGHIAVLVNNAGVRPRHVFDSEKRDAEWRHAFEVNVDGIRNLTLACVKSLSQTKGSVVNITSIAAHQASVESIAYSTSKAAASMLTKVMALELAHLGIRVNALAPGVIETDMTLSSRKNTERNAFLMGRIPMKRFGHPQDLVGPVVFLASSLSNYVTGAVLAVDGGYLIT